MGSRCILLVGKIRNALNEGLVWGSAVHVPALVLSFIIVNQQIGVNAVFIRSIIISVIKKQRLKYFFKEIFMGFNALNPSPGNNPFLCKGEPIDDLHAEWNGLMKEWAEIEKENELLDIYCTDGIDSHYE